MPAWLAVIVHVPTEIMVTVFPETVQTGWVVEANRTGSPEVAVALNRKGAVPKVTAFKAPKAMAWLESAGPTAAVSLAVEETDPPPDTVTWLVTVAGALLATLISRLDAKRIQAQTLIGRI